MAKTVWISGASRGIGKSAVLHFARAGYKIAAGYHENDTAMQSLMQQLAEIGAMAVPVKGDIADPAAVESMAEYICSTLGGIDVLIANAGVAHYSMLEDMAYNEWRRVIDTDLTGVYNMIHASLPSMRNRGGGSIINVSSVWGIYGGSCEAAYSAAKAGVIGLTKALSRELGSSGIRVNCVAPGVIDTDMMVKFDETDRQQLIDSTPLGRLGTVDDVAGAMLFLASDSASFITGQVLEVGGGFPY